MVNDVKMAAFFCSALCALAVYCKLMQGEYSPYGYSDFQPP